MLFGFVTALGNPQAKGPAKKRGLDHVHSDRYGGQNCERTSKSDQKAALKARSLRVN